jgi:hypothetical protein
LDGSSDTPRERSQLARWVELATQKKQIFDWPSWQLQSARQRKAGEVPSGTDQFTLAVLLSDETGVSIEGLELRIIVWRDRPHDDATALLQVEDGSWMTISRLDCWPNSPHINTYWKRLQQPPQIEGSHVHRCEDNARLGRRAFNPFANLPSAMPVDSSPQSFRDMMVLVENYFNVDGASKLPPPDWQGRLI